LHDREYERVGDVSTRRANVRIITATNRDLDSAVKEGRFREDLFYRLNVIQIDLPPLRERKEDVLPLAERMLAGLRTGHRPSEFTDEVNELLLHYGWPGNVRELRNVIERAVILCTGERIGREHLPASFAPASAGSANVGDRVSLDQLEEAHIRRVLAACDSLEEAAQVLGIDVATLWRRRKKYGI
jgi:two-component system, NtrC family, response regulator AlgB